MEAGTSGFISISDSDHRVPAELGQESQASSCLRKGTPLASRVAQGVSGPSSSCVRNPGSLRKMHGRGSAPSCCAFTHRVAFEEGSGPRFLLKSGPGNRGRSACDPTHEARLEFPRKTGLILRCAGKAANPFQTRSGIASPVASRRGEGAQRKRCRDLRCSPRGNPVCRGTLGGRWKAVRDRFALQGGTGDFP